MSYTFIPEQTYKHQIDPKIADMTLVYKKISDLDLQRMLFKYMVNGKFPPEKGIEAAYEVAEMLIIDWENVNDTEDNSVKFEKEYVLKLDILIILDFYDAVIAPVLKKFTEIMPALAERGKQTREALEGN